MREKENKKRREKNSSASIIFLMWMMLLLLLQSFLLFFSRSLVFLMDLLHLSFLYSFLSRPLPFQLLYLWFPPSHLPFPSSSRVIVSLSLIPLAPASILGDLPSIESKNSFSFCIGLHQHLFLSFHVLYPFIWGKRKNYYTSRSLSFHSLIIIISSGLSSCSTCYTWFSRFIFSFFFLPASRLVSVFLAEQPYASSPPSSWRMTAKDSLRYFGHIYFTQSRDYTWLEAVHEIRMKDKGEKSTWEKEGDTRRGIWRGQFHYEAKKTARGSLDSCCFSWKKKRRKKTRERDNSIPSLTLDSCLCFRFRHLDYIIVRYESSFSLPNDSPQKAWSTDKMKHWFLWGEQR